MGLNRKSKRIKRRVKRRMSKRMGMNMRGGEYRKRAG
jgi:hypothetical protein